MHEICAAIASETAILDALNPHYDLQSLKAEFEWAAGMARTDGLVPEIQWEPLIAVPRKFPLNADGHMFRGTLKFYLMMDEGAQPRNPALVSLFASMHMRSYVPRCSEADSRWRLLLITRALTLGAPVALAAMRFVAWHYLATRSSTREQRTVALALAIGMARLTSQFARHSRDFPSGDFKLGALGPEREVDLWRAAIDDILASGSGVDESLRYAREAMGTYLADLHRYDLPEPPPK